MTDPAAHARTVQHIEPDEKPMRIDVHDYAEPKPRPRYIDARPFAWLMLVAIAALFVAVLVIVGRVV